MLTAIEALDCAVQAALWVLLGMRRQGIVDHGRPVLFFEGRQNGLLARRGPCSASQRGRPRGARGAEGPTTACPSRLPPRPDPLRPRPAGSVRASTSAGIASLPSALRLRSTQNKFARKKTDSGRSGTCASHRSGPSIPRHAPHNPSSPAGAGRSLSTPPPADSQFRRRIATHRDRRYGRRRRLVPRAAAPQIAPAEGRRTVKTCSTCCGIVARHAL